MGNAQFAFLCSIAGTFPSKLGSSYTLSDKIDRVFKTSGVDGYAGSLSLTTGNRTINLGTLTDLNGDALNLTGKNVSGFCIYVPGANNITFKEGLTNGYSIFPTAGIVVHPHGAQMGYAPNGYGVVGTTDITIDVAGTGTDSFLIILTAFTP